MVEPEVQFWLLGATLTGGGLIYALVSGRTFIQNKWFYRDKSPKHYWFMQVAGVVGFLVAIYNLIAIAVRH